MSSEIFALIFLGISSHNYYWGICLGLPDVHCLTDRWTEWMMHR